MTWLLLLLIGQAAEIPDASAQVQVTLSGKPIELFTYRPAAFRDGPLLIVFHGTLRDADVYRDHSREMADRLGALVVVPRFDRERFPGSKYNGGGLMGAGSEVAPRDTWTWSMIPQLIDEVRKLEHRPEMPVYVIGHSAGGQFAERLSAFVPIDARRIVVANAGVHLFPSRDLPFAFGFGKLPPELGGDQAIRAYLAQPITIYLGTGDTERDENLATGEYADDEGRTRLERGRNVFQRAEALARERGWPFHWRLVEAPGVAHDHAAMFNHPQCREALFGEEPSAP